jgi:hypothetical protein
VKLAFRTQTKGRAAASVPDEDLLGYRRGDNAAIYRASERRDAAWFRQDGYEFRTWPSTPTTSDLRPTLRGWAPVEDDT